MKPKCKKCGHKGFKILEWSEDRPIKPCFRCDKCCDEFSFGYDGGNYANYAMNCIDVDRILLEYQKKRLY